MPCMPAWLCGGTRGELGLFLGAERALEAGTAECRDEFGADPCSIDLVILVDKKTIFCSIPR